MSDKRLLFLFLLFFAFSRLYLLGDRPFHHDESLFAYYAWELSESGTYLHHPLLHGPLQIQIASLVFRLGRLLGALGDGDAAARLLSAVCAILLVPLLAAFRRPLGRPGSGIALSLAAVSPCLWYYGRFFRNESPFLLATLFLVLCAVRGMRSARPGRWILGGCLSFAGLVALKENCLFVAFDGVTFLLLALFADARTAPGRRVRPVGPRTLFLSLSAHRYAWISGLAAGYLLLELVYTNGFTWDRSFPGMYGEILAYWAGQHREHRLYGEYHYYLPILGLYEPLATVFLAGVLARFLVRRKRVLAGLLCAAAAGLGGGLAGEPGARLLRAFHMTEPWHLGFACATGWAALAGTWTSLRAGRPFRAWLVWWGLLSLLQYSYAGEKVPWLAAHIVLPWLLLAAERAAAWWRSQAGRPVWRAAGTALLVLGVALNLAQGLRLCFLHPTNVAELLVYNHTRPEVRAIGHELRREALAGKRPLLQGEANWPFLWYLHGAPCTFVQEKEAVSLDGIAAVVCDSDYLEAFPEIARRFAPRRYELRQAWQPETLHLFRGTQPSDAADGTAGLCGWSAWKALGRYLVWREFWGAPERTAVPVTFEWCRAAHRSGRPVEP